MIKPLLSLVLSTLLFPVAANAAVINIEYTGNISFTEGTGFGYNIGDAVGGHVQIDFNKALGFTTPSANIANYYAADDQHDFISGYHTAARGKSVDMVDVYDAAYEQGGAFEDGLSVSDSDSEFLLDEFYNYTSKFYSRYLTVLLPGVDWLDANALLNLNVDITDPAALVASSGQIYNVFATGNGTDYITSADVAQFTFSSLKITASDSPVAVPETNTLWLLMVAFAGLLIGRARNKAPMRD
ncbi:MAG: hypothetical protein K0Q78_716 [Cellvibrio sp.]|nr:hypothetical protein [Cellvibrio sp.]